MVVFYYDTLDNKKNLNTTDLYINKVSLHLDEHVAIQLFLCNSVANDDTGGIFFPLRQGFWEIFSKQSLFIFVSFRFSQEFYRNWQKIPVI